MTVTVEVLRDYHQFFLLDGGIQPLYPEEVTAVDINRGYKIAPNIIAIYTAGPCTVTVRLAKCFAVLDPGFQHLTDLTIDLPSGKVIITRYTDYLPDCPVLIVPPGSYNVRINVGSPSASENEWYLVTLLRSEAPMSGMML